MTPPIHFVFFRQQDGCHVMASSPANTRPLDPRNDLLNHSPTGFEWGYRGSGPAQLALALAAAVLQDDDRALSVHQRLKDELVAKLDRFWTSFTIRADEIAVVINRIEQERAE